MLRAAAGAISRARAGARAHLYIQIIWSVIALVTMVLVVPDLPEAAEIQGLQLWVLLNLKHAWPRASSAAGEARCDARGGVGAISRARARADEGARAP